MTEGAEFMHERLVERLADALTTSPPGGTPRKVFGAVSLAGKATAVIGMRRAGKTMFLHQLVRERLARGVPRERLLFVNFEDDRLAGVTTDSLDRLVEEYYRRYPALRGRETVTWCLDEIQTVPGWERFVRRLLDTEKVEVFVSGSSAALLSRVVATALRGRAWEVLMHPFGFEEALRHGGHEVPERPDFLDARAVSALERAFLDYLEVGGFPEVQRVDAATRFRLLQDYVDVAMLRDVVERYQVTNVAGLRWLVRHLLGNAAGRFSAQRFYGALKSQGFSISKDTVHQLLAHLQDCFLVRTVWQASASERQRMVNPRKAYPVDPGLIPVFDRSGRSNRGHALETAVLLELERRRADIAYVATPGGFDVDFLARFPDGAQELIQVCTDASDPVTGDREVRALEEAGRQFPLARRRLLTATRDGLPRRGADGIAAQPAYVWMLTQPG